MYGQTEATSRMSYLSWEHARTKTGSIGRAIPGGDFWIEDDNGNIIEESDRPGELAYRGDNVTLGYAESYFDLCKGDENKGVLLTGDIVKRDEDDFYYIVGRKKRFLKMFGNRVSLDEIEQLVKSFGFDCVCTGTDDNLKIYITQPDNENSVLSYIAKCTGINQNKIILETIDKIPRNDSGKVLYTALE
jgi:acyl-coenzyme A synthetase/AMP-(fatty) acid ligase